MAVSLFLMNSGDITVAACAFLDNAAFPMTKMCNEDDTGTAGIFLLLSRKAISQQYFIFSDILFCNNTAVNTGRKQCHQPRLGNGGAMSIYLSNGIEDIQVQATNLTFRENSATKGGALYFGVTTISRVRVVVENCTFKGNHAVMHQKNGGQGGALYYDVSILARNGKAANLYVFNRENTQAVENFNEFFFINTIFEENYASQSGGAVAMFTTADLLWTAFYPDEAGLKLSGNGIMFLECLWVANRAGNNGAAIYAVGEVTYGMWAAYVLINGG